MIGAAKGIFSHEGAEVDLFPPTGRGEALAMLQAVKPQLMIIDFSMPGTNGAEVVKEARLMQPSRPVLFVSGYADSAALETAMGSAPCLRKPFLPAELATAVRGSLGAG